MFQNFKPARSAQDEPMDMKIVCDFDALLTESVGFKFKNRFYKLNNVDLENFMQVTVAYRELLSMAELRSQGQSLLHDEIYMKYFNLIHPLVPDFDYEDLKQLPFVLLNQLVNLILRQLAGDPDLHQKTSEKKNPLNPALM